MAPFLILLVTGASAAHLFGFFIWTNVFGKHTSSWLITFHLSACLSDVLHNILVIHICSLPSVLVSI